MATHGKKDGLLLVVRIPKWFYFLSFRLLIIYGYLNRAQTNTFAHFYEIKTVHNFCQKKLLENIGVLSRLSSLSVCGSTLLFHFIKMKILRYISRLCFSDRLKNHIKWSNRFFQSMISSHECSPLS